MPIIECLVGLISSGKSIYARKRADEGALCVAHDDLCAMLHAHRDGKGYEDGLRHVYRLMEACLVDVAIQVAKRDVIVDRNHLTRESRARWVDIGRVLAVPVVAVVFPDEGSEIHARRRFQADARGRTFDEWLMVAEHHAEQARAEPISIEEGFAEIRYVKRVEDT